MNLSPSLKGLITAALMIGVFLLVFRISKTGSNTLQLGIYAIYAAGIAWTLLAYRSSPAFTAKFADAFQQGFRCFVVVTLSMALFYWIFNYFHPEFSEQTAQALREQLNADRSKLPTEVDDAVSTFKKQYTLKLVSGAIFGYLIIGAGITAAVSALIIRRK